MAIFFPRFRMSAACFEFDPGGQLLETGRIRRGVMHRVSLRAALLDLLYLDIHGNCDVRNPTRGKGGTNGQIHETFHVRSAHHPLIEGSHIDEELVECNILLRESPDQIAVL
jgi:hypothetical protein